MKELWGNLKFAWKYAKNEKKQIITYGVLHLLGIIISIAVPVISASMILKLTSNLLTQTVFLAFCIFAIRYLEIL
ncbi:MAG: hypothetical protein IJ772_06465 [Bacilli bacterium]|nr:hypothetical protein [Bacilli bacterium]